MIITNESYSTNIANDYPVVSLASEERDFVRVKIEELFAVRRLNHYINFLGISTDCKKKVLENLACLQESIYALDLCGERVWKPDTQVLNFLWEMIFQKLEPWNLSKTKAVFLVKDMKAYQKIEAGLRFGYSPADFPIKEFYYFKACDVRLSRSLIASLPSSHHKNNEKTTIDLWNYYDMLGEIYDDVSDIKEDISTFNCNRFLFQCEKQGVSKTKKEYEAFIVNLEARLQTAISQISWSPETQQIYDWFLEAKNEVVALLNYWETNFILARASIKY